MYEYYRQAQEIVPAKISKVLYRLFTSEGFQIVNTRYVFCLWSELQVIKFSSIYFV